MKSKLTHNPKGFSLVEVLLGILTATVLVFVGFYIYSQKHKDTNSSKAARTSETTKADDADESPVQYLEIKELGIKIVVTSDLKGLRYAMSPTDSDIAVLTTASFQRAVGDCRTTAASGSVAAIGIVTRVAGQYDNTAMPEDFFSEFAKQFPEFYITYGTADGGPSLLCTDKVQSKIDKVTQLFNKLSPALKKAVQNAQPI